MSVLLKYYFQKVTGKFISFQEMSCRDLRPRKDRRGSKGADEPERMSAE